MRHRNSAVVASLSVLALGSLAAAPAGAFEIDTGNPDVVLRWDNTVRYNYGVRMKDRDPHLLANSNADDGNRNFDKGQAVTNRLDLLTEIDMVIDKKYGFRVSGAAWTDAAYRNLADDANRAATYNGLGGPGSLSNYSSRYAKGFSGELLDAFVFASFDAGDVPVSARLGRHTAYWGEGLLLGGAVHGVSYGQYALDIWKSSATPGSEAKELFRPRNGLTVQIQPTKELTIVGQTFFDWEAARLPESGTYLAGSDALLFGGQSFFLGPTRVLQGKEVTPDKTGDFGLAVRWSPEWLDGTAGFYVRRTADIAQQTWLDVTAIGPRYHLSFASDIDIFGFSLNKKVGDFSVGAEISMRKDMPLVSQPALAVGPTIGRGPALRALAAKGEVPGARGDTTHVVLNAVSILSQNPVFDTASVVAELTWNRVLDVTSDPFNLYKGTNAYSNGTTAGAKNIDAVTRDASTLSVNFTPVWLSAFPSVDISLPMTYSVGLNGNSGVASGGNEEVGSWSIGLTADILSKHNLSLRYISAFGPYSKVPAGPLAGAAAVAAGPNSLISDRDMLVLTFKTSF